jgi:hypothetical protein
MDVKPLRSCFGLACPSQDGDAEKKFMPKKPWESARKFKVTRVAELFIQ